RIRYINLDLPAALQADRKWTKQILPALVTWAGSLADPWLIPDQDLMCAIQIIITTISTDFLDLSAICPGTPIFSLATRRLTVWRSNFGSTTIAIIAHFLAAGPSNDIDAESMDLPAIQETCNDLLERFSFLYQDLDHQNPANTFCSQFILQLLAHTHLRSCIRCPDILALRTDTLKVFGVQGALVLSCAALEHAIQLFQRGDMDIDNQISTWGKATAKTPLKLNRTSGKESSAALAFSEQNWGTCTRHYYTSVAKRDHLALTEIVSMANALVSLATDSLLDDGSLRVDSAAEDLGMSIDQCMNICRTNTLSLHGLLT
ncbi:hypothetical protein M404DRAFT_118971, partial [Pisolithus tinctorius Marx 270]